MVRPTINSEKHIVQIGFNNADIGTTTTQNLVQVVQGATAGAREVRVGAVVKAIYIELWFQGEGMTTGTSIAILEKAITGLDPPSTLEMLDLHDYANKKNIIFTHQGLSSDQNTNAVPIMRGWYNIPKGKQRMSLGDRWDLQFLAQVDGFNFCGLAIFKEYF